MLQSYGLNYPKQSVAVALLRLAISSKIRRFKGEGGEFVCTSAISIAAPIVRESVAVDLSLASDEDVQSTVSTCQR